MPFILSARPNPLMVGALETGACRPATFKKNIVVFPDDSQRLFQANTNVSRFHRPNKSNGANA